MDAPDAAPVSDLALGFQRLTFPWLGWVFAGALVAGVACFVPIGDSDAGWHLALGRLIAQHGLPSTNALAWTARDVPWYDTSWLWDLASYALTARFGLIGLQGLTFVAFGLALWALGWACEKADPGRGAWLVPAIALLLVPRLTVRPHVATWTGFAAVLALCLASERGGWRWRAACIPVIAFAGNLHSGAPFAAGLLGLWCAQAFSRRSDLREAAIAAGGVLALCANPGLTFNLRSLVWHLRVQELVVIGEYLPPHPLVEPAFYLLLPLALLLAWRVRRERPAVLASVVLFAALGLKAQRMVYEFEILIAPLLATGLAQVRARHGVRLQAAVVLLATLLAGASHRRLPATRLAPEWDPQKLPVRAVAFATQQGIDGRLFNAYDDGGFLEWAQPGTPAFVDGRVQCFPAEFFRRFYSASHSPRDFQAWLRELDVEWAMPRRTSPWLSGRDLLHGPEWALVYWDNLNEVLLRRDVPRFAARIERLEYRHFRPTGLVVGNVAATPVAEVPALLAELDRFAQTTPGDPLALVVRCAALSRAALAGSEEACARAEQATAGDENARRLVTKARALHR